MGNIVIFLILVCIISLLKCDNTPNIAVLILARGGSKGVHLKNLKQIGGKSLISIAIQTAQLAGIRDITVSTDHPLIALEAIQNNASVFHRSKVTAVDWAPSIWGALEFISYRRTVDVLVLLQATSPFVKPSSLRQAISKLNKPIAFDCLFTVARSHKLRWRYEKGKLKPANFNPDKRPRRQDWDGEYLETGAFYISRRALLLNGHFQNNNCTFWEVSNLESLEVDTYNDIRIANALHKENIFDQE